MSGTVVLHRVGHGSADRADRGLQVCNVVGVLRHAAVEIADCATDTIYNRAADAIARRRDRAIGVHGRAATERHRRARGMRIQLRAVDGVRAGGIDRPGRDTGHDTIARRAGQIDQRAVRRSTYVDGTACRVLRDETDIARGDVLLQSRQTVVERTKRIAHRGLRAALHVVGGRRHRAVSVDLRAAAQRRDKRLELAHVDRGTVGRAGRDA